MTQSDNDRKLQLMISADTLESGWVNVRSHLTGKHRRADVRQQGYNFIENSWSDTKTPLLQQERVQALALLAKWGEVS